MKFKEYIIKNYDSVARSVIKNSSLAVILQIAVALSSFVETFIFTKSLGLALFGTFTIVYSISELVYGILDFRTGEAVIKYLPEVKQNIGTKGISSLLRFLMGIDLLIGVTGFILILILNKLFLNWFNIDQKYLFILTIVSIGASFKFTVRCLGSYFRVINEFQTLIKFHIGWVVFKLLIFTLLYLNHPDIKLIAIGSLIADVSFFIVTISIAIKSFSKYNLNPFISNTNSIAYLKKSIIKFIFSTNIASTLKVISSKLDVLVISALSPVNSAAQVVGLYKVASRVSGSLLMFSDPLLTAVYPEISRLSATGEQKKIRGLLIMLTKILFLVCTTYFVGMYFFGGYILGILGKEYISALNVILVMIIGVSSAVIFFWARPMLLVHGKASKTIWATLISISLQFSVLYFLVPKYGELGAGIASASSYIVAVIVFLIFLTQKTIK